MAEYIWYCPRRCNAIVTKTKRPHLNRDEEYRCKHCNAVFRGDVLMILNKKNIEKGLLTNNGSEKKA